MTKVKPKNVYIFFGHGWTTDQTFSISENSNTNIIMLKDVLCLMEDPTNKHRQAYMKAYDKDIDKFQNTYLKYLYDKASEMKNEMCVYDDVKYQEVPDLLLTTYTKHGELSMLQKVGDIRSIKLEAQVFLLSDLVKMLGKNFVLLLWTCRAKLDPFQMKNLEIFDGTEDIKDVIKERNLNMFEDDDITYVSPPCKDYVL